MGLLDDTLRQLAQGGNANQPLVAVFQELLTGKPQAGGQPSAQQQASMPQTSSPQDLGFGGLGGLIAQLQKGGLDEIVKSWVGTGQNKPVQPDELGDALGKKAVTQMADKCGCSQDDLLTQLSKALPGIIDKLTQDGRVPSQQEVNQRLKN
jgi:uncharacterized protein YidB (DUF937 family)